MEILFTVINVIVLLVFLVMLNIMARKHVSFPKRVFTALGIGIVFGIVLALYYTSYMVQSLKLSNNQQTGLVLSGMVMLHYYK